VRCYIRTASLKWKSGKLGGHDFCFTTCAGEACRTRHQWVFVAGSRCVDANVIHFAERQSRSTDAAIFGCSDTDRALPGVRGFVSCPGNPDGCLHRHKPVDETLLFAFTKVDETLLFAFNYVGESNLVSGSQAVSLGG
jgi:hypothetical protein